MLSEKELVREVESLKYLKRSPSGPGGPNGRNKPLPTKLDSYVKNLESERDFYKREVDTLQELLRTARSSSASRLSRRESSRGGVGATTRSKSPVKPGTNTRQKSTSPVKTTPTPTPPHNRSCTVCSGRSMSPGQQHLAVEEIKKLKREKDELKGLVDNFEGYMEQVNKLK